MEIDLTEKLIEAVKKRPVLYSSSHPYNRNRLWQLEAWREIEEELNKDVTYLKNKWWYLKGTYTQFKRFQRIANNSPSHKRVKLSHWVWGKYLSFLDENNVEVTQDPLNETQSSSQQLTANEEDSDNSATNDTPISSPHREESVKIEPISEPSFSLAEHTKKRYSGRRRLDSDPKMDEKEENEEGKIQNIQKSTNTFDNSSNSEKVEVKCDAVDLFFLGYANTFKRLSRRKQVLVKFDIAKAFMEAELGDISDR